MLPPFSWHLNIDDIDKVPACQVALTIVHKLTSNTMS